MRLPTWSRYWSRLNTVRGGYRARLHLQAGIRFGIVRVMKTAALTSLRMELDMRPESFGELQASNDLLGDVPALHQRMQQNGYIFLRQYLDVQQVLAARTEIVQGYAAAKALDL